MAISAFHKLPRIFIIELFTYLIFLGFGLWLLSLIAGTINNALEISSENTLSVAEAQVLRSTVGLSITLWIVLFAVIGLIVWVLSRYTLWRVITGKKLDSHHILENLLLGVPFNLIQFGLMALIFYVGFIILQPFLGLHSFALVVTIGELIMLIVVAPLLFNLTGFSAIAYYWYFKHNDAHYLMPLFRKGNYKYKHINPDYKKWERAVLLFACTFVALNILLIFVNLLPPYLNWGLMLCLYVLFVSWGKLYLVEKVFG